MRRRDANRQHVRVILAAPVSIQLVRETEKGDAAACNAALFSHMARQGGSSDQERVAMLPDGWLDFLIQMDRKLDHLIALLGGQKEGADVILVEKAIDLSGSGLRLLLDRELPLGQPLWLSLSLPGTTGELLTLRGQVVRVVELDGGSPMEYETGITFVDISEADREKIIAFAFSQQRETIRQEKRIGQVLG